MSVVVGYLLSERGRKALDLGIREARLRNTDLVVVHSIHGGVLADDKEVIKSDRDLQELEDQLGTEGIEFSVHNFVRGNEPAEDLVKAAQDFDAEVIVIGLRHRTTAGEFLLGSNAHEILMSAPCPVLTVRAE